MESPKGNWQLIAAFCGKTFQKVKRAAPGGEGYVMDHLSGRAVKNYLNRFERAFEASGEHLIRITSSMILTKYIRQIGLKIFLMNLPHGADINWKSIPEFLVG